mmetsp:Transcript_69511/g.85239  ORF Transcript_69511/g.85239 Transcript_69511/m.85239 type:complete len:461 (+) Transcript_69511:112-1494(+)
MADEKKDIIMSDAPYEAKAAARPQVTIYGLNGEALDKSVVLPDVCLAPIRQDIVNFVHTNMNKNARQPYGVKCGWGPKGIVAGMQNAARSWGTGRAVSRIPRVKGGGTHRAGQGAYGNMCRGGRIFAPTKVWRKWHRKINKNQKRYAVCSSIAASCVPALVMARGHRIQTVQEVPIIVESSFESIKKTRAVMNTMKSLKLSSELMRCKKRYIRAGKGKMRNRRFRRRVGPLIVYKKNDGIVQASRNIPGVDSCIVTKLNLLKLAPGGHVGRLIIWTQDAWEMLNDIYGTTKTKSILKKNYIMPRPMMLNSDLTRIINSVEIQSAIKPKKVVEPFIKKRNPLKRPQLYAELNPLFEQQWNDIKKNYPKGTKPTTTKVLRPLYKKQKVTIDVTDDERAKMKAYYQMVIGKSPFKSRALLAKEKQLVAEAIERARREKAGEDSVKKDSPKKPESGDDDDSDSS